MKNKNLKMLAVLFLGIALANSCTKAEKEDDFPAGDVPTVPGGYVNSSEVATANLVAYWGFDGDLTDAVTGTSGTNHNMTFSTGLKGQALQGSADPNDSAYATAPASAAVAALSQYTLSCWVNTDLNVGATGIVSLGDVQNFWGNINIFFENGGNASLARFKTIFENNGTVFDNGIQEVNGGFNKWVQYTISYDGDSLFKSYVNGSLAATKSLSPGNGGPINFINVGPVVFGALHFMTSPSSTAAATPQTWAGYIPGKIDEVRIYDKALSAQEVSAIAILEKQGR